MAADIKVVSSIQASKLGTVIPLKGGQFDRDWAGKDFDAGKQVINTSAVDAQGTLITLKSSIGNPGVSWFHNCDTVNFCTFGPRSAGTYVPFVGNVLPGEWWAFPLATAANACYGQADTAALDAEFLVIER